MLFLKLKTETKRTKLPIISIKVIKNSWQNERIIRKKEIKIKINLNIAPTNKIKIQKIWWFQRHSIQTIRLSWRVNNKKIEINQLKKSVIVLQ